MLFKKKLQKYDHISRNGIFRFLWMNLEITNSHKSYLMDAYPQLRILMSCIREFREIFQKKSMPCVYLFIEKYKNGDLKEVSRFVSSIERDLSAVENAVASSLSNGFVEGTNSKLKMIKRTMYGRCSKELLAAKLIYMSKATTDNCGRTPKVQTGGSESSGIIKKAYRDLIELILRIGEYILRNQKKARKGLGDVMGGKVLELESDRLIQEGMKRGLECGLIQGRTQGLEQGIAQGRTQGLEQGIAKSVRALLHKGKTVEEIADLLDLTVEYVRGIQEKI